MAIVLIFVNAHVTARAVEDNTPSAFTHEEQVTSRVVDDETNHLVKELFSRMYGEEALRAELARLHDTEMPRSQVTRGADVTES